jgi:GNAT superfamily N-acetyltransferase
MSFLRVVLLRRNSSFINRYDPSIFRNLFPCGGSVPFIQKQAVLIQLKRTDADDKAFQRLVTMLDAELRHRDGEDHFFYAQFNSLDRIKHAVVAYHEGEALGCGAFRPYGEGIAEVKRMFVKENVRGQGIAAQILRELEIWAQEHQFRKCILETGFNQPEAIALYRKCGYRVIPNYGPYADVDTSICMEKDLLPPA